VALDADRFSSFRALAGRYKAGPGDAACTNCEAAKFSAAAGATACDIHEGLVP